MDGASDLADLPAWEMHVLQPHCGVLNSLAGWYILSHDVSHILEASLVVSPAQHHFTGTAHCEETHGHYRFPEQDRADYLFKWSFHPTIFQHVCQVVCFGFFFFLLDAGEPLCHSHQ